MKRNLLLVLLVFSLVFLYSESGFSQVNEYYLVPVDLHVEPGDSSVEVDIYIHTIDTVGIGLFEVCLFAEGTSNPVLDTTLTGGLSDFTPAAFDSSTLLAAFPTKIVNPYGPPSDPLFFVAHAFVSTVPPSNGLFCKMFFKVSGPGTLTFRTAVHSTAGATAMLNRYGDVPINWPAAGVVGSFMVLPPLSEYSLVPGNLKIRTCDSTVDVYIYINTLDTMAAFKVPLFAEGTSNPVLDTAKSGGLGNPNPSTFALPSLVSGFSTKYVAPQGPPTDPLVFVTRDFTKPLPPSNGLFCRMFYKVSGPGTLTFRTAVHSLEGAVGMWKPDGSYVYINWPVDGEVGSFNVTAEPVKHGDANCDGLVTLTDVFYLTKYLFKGGPSPSPFDAGDANCDGRVTVTDVVYLINYLFKSGPPPPC
ncbi:MAG TPA: dockerin type I repeat-containing protein [Terriglobales bacterium]|nr:dockerin type I repeat-containing protein [Terriglobales bacterium]